MPHNMSYVGDMVLAFVLFVSVIVLIIMGNIKNNDKMINSAAPISLLFIGFIISLSMRQLVFESVNKKKN